MTVASPTPTGVSALRDDLALAPRGPFALTWDFLRRQPVGSIGMFLVLAFGLAGIFADVLAPYNPTANDFAAMTEPPSWAHLLGTDQLGRDLLSRILYRRAHRFSRRADRGRDRRLCRPDPRRRERLFRRSDRSLAAALHRHLHGVSADHHGAGGRVDLRHRHRERDRRDHHPARSRAAPASFVRARWRSARFPTSMRRAPSALDMSGSFCAIWCRM